MSQPSKVIDRAIELLSDRVNLATGLTHSSDKGTATELFVRLHEFGEVLRFDEIQGLAEFNGWQPQDARGLGLLAQRIADGKTARVRGGPYWKDDIIEQLQRPLVGY